jgi:multidrug resistance protein
MRKRGSGGKGAAKSAFPVLFSVVFLNFLGFAIVIPYLFFFAESLGATPFTYGLLVSSFALMQFIFMPVLGRLSDRYGRRRLIMISLLGASASYLVFGLADSLWLLFLSRIMAGVTASTYSVAQAYLADLTAEGDRLRYLGLLGAASGAALILAPALGGTLSSIYGYSMPSFLAAGLALANLVFAYFRLPEPPRARSGAGGTKGTFSALAEILRKGELKLLFYSYFSVILAVVFMDVALTPWLEVTMGYGPFEAGLLFFYIGIGQVLSRAVLLPRLARVLSHVDLTLLGLVLNTVSYISFGLMPGNLPLLLIFGFLLVLGFSVTSSTINTLISLNTPEDLQGGLPRDSPIILRAGRDHRTHDSGNSLCPRHLAGGERPSLPCGGPRQRRASSANAALQGQKLPRHRQDLRCPAAGAPEIPPTGESSAPPAVGPAVNRAPFPPPPQPLHEL